MTSSNGLGEELFRVKSSNLIYHNLYHFEPTDILDGLACMRLAADLPPGLGFVLFLVNLSAPKELFFLVHCLNGLDAEDM